MAKISRTQLFWLGFFVLALFLLVLVRGILLPFILAVFLTYMTLPAVQLLERREVPRSLAIILVYLSLAIIIWAGIVFLLPKVVDDLNSLLENLEQQTERLDGLARYINVKYQRLDLPDPLQRGIDDGLATGRQFLQNLITRIIDLILQTISKSFFLLLAPFLAYYMSRDIRLIKQSTIEAFPPEWRPEVLEIGREVNRVLSGFIRGQLLISVFVGLSLSVGLVFLEIPYALIIGIVAGILNIIPYFGSAVGALPALLAALGSNPAKILYVLGLFLAVNQFEALVLAPAILQDEVGLHPVMVIFAVLAGGQIYGVIGTLIAVPIAAIVKVLYLYCRNKYAPVDARP